MDDSHLIDCSNIGQILWSNLNSHDPLLNRDCTCIHIGRTCDLLHEIVGWLIDVVMQENINFEGIGLNGSRCWLSFSWHDKIIIVDISVVDER